MSIPLEIIRSTGTVYLHYRVEKNNSWESAGDSNIHYYAL